MNLIVAIGKDGSIGRGGDLIWHIREDLKRFKSLTMGHQVIMGRKTWESLPRKPLAGRRNIIITRQKDFQAEGADVVNSIEEAISIAKNGEGFIIGGAEIYNAFLPYVNRLYLTRVEKECDDADVFLNIDVSKGWQLVEESCAAETPEGISYRYQTYDKTI